MSSMSDQQRAANTMTPQERDELVSQGWHLDVVASLRIRGFRPCKPDYVAARFEGIDLNRTMGFIRQTAFPHLHITVARDESAQTVMERIDTAILEAGMKIGHEALAGSFMSFVDRCKAWKPLPDMSAIESRLAKLEERLANNQAVATASETHPNT